MITDGDLLNPTTKNKQSNDITDGDLLNPTTKNKQSNDITDGDLLNPTTKNKQSNDLLNPTTKNSVLITNFRYCHTILNHLTPAATHFSVTSHLTFIGFETKYSLLQTF